MKIRIGDKIVEANENGVVKATIREIKRPDGRIDVEVYVPCIQLKAKEQTGEQNG